MTAATGHRPHPAARRYLHWLAFAPVGAVALMTMASPSDEGPTLCPVALVTGVACPGCGMSRAVGWLLRGDLERSVGYHPLAPLVLTIGLVAVVWALGWRFGGWKVPRTTLVSAGSVVFGVLLVAVWVARLLNGTLPPV